MRIVALDLSLTATGYAIASSEDPTAWRWKPDHLGLIQPNGRRGFERVDYLRRRTLELVHGADVVVIEGYSFGSKGRAVFSIAEMGGVIRMTLHDLGFPWAEVSPAALKKLATGRGNAPKEEVLVAAVQRLEYAGHDNNEADALWLLEAALIQYGIAKPCVPKSHLVALEKVEWPRFTNVDGSRLTKTDAEVRP